jgi:hypothetical protein
VFDGAPILHVTHDDDDGWQFLCLEGADADQAAIVSLSESVELDPSVLQVANLPPGWHAWRQSNGSPSQTRALEVILSPFAVWWQTQRAMVQRGARGRHHGKWYNALNH